MVRPCRLHRHRIETFWPNVPAAAWTYKLGGYQILKKWLSYREHSILNRALTPEQVQHLTNTAQRISMILQTTDNERKKNHMNSPHPLFRGLNHKLTRKAWARFTLILRS